MSNSDDTSTGSLAPSSAPVIIRVHTSRQARITGPALQTLIDNYRVPYNGAETIRIVGSEQVQFAFELFPNFMNATRNRVSVHPRNANYNRKSRLNRGTRVFNSDFITGMFADLPPIPFAMLDEEFPTPTPPAEVQVANVEQEPEHNVPHNDLDSDCPSEYYSINNSTAALENSVWSLVQDHSVEEGNSDGESDQKSRSGSLSDSDDNKSDVTAGSRDESGTVSPIPSGNVERLAAALTSFSIQTAKQSFRTIPGSLVGMLPPLVLPFSSMTSPESSSASSSVVGTATAASDPGYGDYFSGLGDEDYDHLNVEEVLANLAEATPFLAVWIEQYPSGDPIITVVEVNDTNPAHPTLVMFIRMKATAQSIDSVKFYPNSGYRLTKVSNAVGRTRPGHGTALDSISIQLKPQRF